MDQFQVVLNHKSTKFMPKNRSFGFSSGSTGSKTKASFNAFRAVAQNFEVGYVFNLKLVTF